MTNGDAGIGYVLQYHLLEVLQVGDAVVDEVHLSVARQLEVDGIGYDFGTKGVYLCLDGVSVGRRRLDNAEIAGTNKRELQRSRNGRCRHCQRINIGTHLSQLLLSGDTELLLLVDDKQT